MRTNAEVAEATHRRIRIAELKLRISRCVECAMRANRELLKLKRMDRLCDGRHPFAGQPEMNSLRAARDSAINGARHLQQQVNDLRGKAKMSTKAPKKESALVAGEDQPFTVITSQGLHHGLSTYFAHVMAPDADEAIIFAVAEASNSQECDADEIDVLGVFPGHHSPVRWADGGVEYDLSRFTKRLVTILPKV